jgi:uncharacterized protein YgiM (DUF1202 family)
MNRGPGVLFGTVAILPSGEKVLINAVTSRAGWIYVEVVDAKTGRTVPNRSFNDSIPLYANLFEEKKGGEARTQ